VANSDPPVPQGLVAGKFRLTRLLGRGGMGAVWEGTHTTLGSRVAVKFIDAEYAESPEARSRFENEARAAARLRSKHVVEVYDHGVSDDGRPFIVMEFLDGEPLDKRLDRVGRLTAKETAHIVLQVCRGLTKAHAAGIVHRDLKPENVFLVRDEEEGTDIAKVVDFGIAKFSDASIGSASATRTGSVLGTPHYMSPEQARGLRSVDARSDLWSVAVIAYRCIVGALPFEGEAVGDLLVKLCTAPIPVPSQLVPDVPPSFDAWLERALNREPAQRFSNAAELAESLAAVCGLSLRGHFTSIGGSGAYSALARSIAPSVASERISGSYSDASRPSNGLGGRPAALVTGAPTTQTPAPLKRGRTSAIVAAAVMALLVLGVGGAVAVKKLSGTAGGAAMPRAVLAPEAVQQAPGPQRSPVAPAPLAASVPLIVPAAPVVLVQPAPSASAPAVAPSPVAKPVQAPPKPPVPARPPLNRPSAKGTNPIAKPSNDIGF
jgi:serine/threonine protein kinase